MTTDTELPDDVSGDPAGTADADLVLRARSGDSAAFGELWQRHYRSGIVAARSISANLDADDLVQEAYTKIFQAIQRGGGPTGAFRSYLFTTIRNVAASWGRGMNEAPSAELEMLTDPDSSEAAAEAALDRSITTTAFRSLPTRWQEVLWYTEVEQMKPAEVAPLLGMKAAAVSQLAFRAREGLREAWIQAHIASVPADSEHAWTIDHLGAYTRGNLSSRDKNTFEAHLNECARCTIVAAEASEVGSRLALVLLPVMIGVVGTAGFLAALQRHEAATVALAAMPSSVVAGAVVAGGTAAGAGGAGGGAGANGLASGAAGWTIAGLVGAGIAAAAIAVAVVTTTLTGGFGGGSGSDSAAAFSDESLQDASIEASDDLPEGSDPIDDDEDDDSSPAPTASATPSASPTASPSASATPSATDAPTATPTPAAPTQTPETAAIGVASASVLDASSRTVELSLTGEPGSGVEVSTPAAATTAFTTFSSPVLFAMLASTVTTDAVTASEMPVDATFGADGTADVQFALTEAQVQDDCTIVIDYTDLDSAPVSTTLSELGVREALLPSEPTPEPTETAEPTPTPTATET
ncbi:MAG: sigma-70 family RNA polymerase sigma factor, partial [Microbacterium sp.]